MTRRGGALAAVALAAAFLFGQQVVAALPWQLTVATVCALVAAVMLGKALRTSATIDFFEGMELDLRGAPGRLVDYRCAVNGHAFCHPEIHDGHRLWRCEVCGDEVESKGGWVA